MIKTWTGIKSEFELFPILDEGIQTLSKGQSDLEEESKFLKQILMFPEGQKIQLKYAKTFLSNLRYEKNGYIFHNICKSVELDCDQNLLMVKFIKTIKLMKVATETFPSTFFYVIHGHWTGNEIAFDSEFRIESDQSFSFFFELTET